MFPANDYAHEAGSEANARLEEQVAAFEDAWQQGQRPPIEAHLPAEEGPLRRAVLRELVHAELELRLKAGESACAAAYLERYPDLAADPAAAAALRDAEIDLRRRYPAPGATTVSVNPAACRVLLEVVAGPNSGLRFEFEQHATFVAGRARRTHLRLRDDPYFSRHHFLLEFQPPRCYLRDLGSRNGTLVNGERVQEAFLKDGDLIGGGKTRLRIAIQLAGGPTAAADVACPGCGLKMPGGTAPAAAPAASTYLCRACQALARHQPQHVPGYEIVRKLGQGSMGVVYLARRRDTGQRVALKLIVPESASEQAVQLFLRELSILSQLAHPRIVRFHEAGTIRGQFFFAMDYIETVALQEVLAPLARPRAVQMICAIVCQALEGLQYAHMRSFVHRDVKPANLLLSRIGTKVRTWLADFGLAKNFENAGLSGLTRHGDVRGSLAFMAPEQVLDCRNATPAADLYGAGATLYYLLAEQTPHLLTPGRDPCVVLLEEEVVPLEQYVADLPPGLAAVVHKALARNPADRFASAVEMRRALRPYARGEGSGSKE